MNDLRIQQLAHDLGDEEIALRLADMRDNQVIAVPEHVADQHLRAIVSTARTRVDIEVPGPAEPTSSKTEDGDRVLAEEPGRDRKIVRPLLQTSPARVIGRALAASVAAAAAVGFLGVTDQLPDRAQLVLSQIGASLGVELPSPSADGTDRTHGGSQAPPLDASLDGSPAPAPRGPEADAPPPDPEVPSKHPDASNGQPPSTDARPGVDVQPPDHSRGTNEPPEPEAPGRAQQRDPRNQQAPPDETNDGGPVQPEQNGDVPAQGGPDATERAVTGPRDGSDAAEEANRSDPRSGRDGNAGTPEPGTPADGPASAPSSDQEDERVTPSGQRSRAPADRSS